MSTLSPIMPDGGAGISTFNNNSGGSMIAEELSLQDRNSLTEDLMDAAIMYLVSQGYDEDYASGEIDCKLENLPAQTKITIFTPLKSNMELRDLCDTLNPILLDYDSDSYFDETTDGRLIAFISEEETIEESLRKLDKKGFEELSEDFQLEALYETLNLTSQQKSQLKKFIDKTDDPEEVDIYIKGLMKESLTEDIDEESDESFEEENTLNEIIEKIKENYPGEYGLNWTVSDNGLHEKTNAIDFIVEGDWKHDHLTFDYWMKNESEEVTGYVAEKYLSKELSDNSSDDYKSIHGYRFRKPVDELEEPEIDDFSLEDEELPEDNIDFEESEEDMDLEEPVENENTSEDDEENTSDLGDLFN